MSEDKKYMFVVTACDGRHEHKACDTFAEALQDAADWHGRDVGNMVLSSSPNHPFVVGEWEGMDGQITGIEVVGEHDAFMAAELEDDDGPTEAECNKCGDLFHGGGLIPAGGYVCQRCLKEGEQ
mgnify:CR=1 FL=1